MGKAVKIVGAKELQLRLGQIKANKRALRQACATSGEELKQQAQTASPVRTGNLRRSIHRYERVSDNRISETIKAEAPYSGFVEYGTRKQVAKPFLRPAFNYEKPRFEQRVKQAIKE